MGLLEKVNTARNDPRPWSGKSSDPLALRVVVVEDSAIIQERLAETLRGIPNLMTVGYAETQDEALSILREHDWDAVILDLHLKQGTGIAVLEALATGDRPRDTTVIVLSNFDFPQYRSKMKALGADFFFDKSVEFYRLHEVLSELAESSH